YWSSPLRHILRHTLLPNVEAELEKLSMNPWCAPERVGKAHLADQLGHIRRDLWSSTDGSRFPGPEAAKSRSVQPDQRFRPSDRQRIHYARDHATKGNEDQSVSTCKNEPLWRPAAHHIELVPEDKGLKGGPRTQQSDHGA